MGERLFERCVIYKGEGKLLMVPIIPHIAGFSVHSYEVQIISELNNFSEIGSKLLYVREIIKKSPIAKTKPKESEEKSVWKCHSKYKGYKSFCKHYYSIKVRFYGDDECEIYSVYGAKGNQKSGYIKDVILPMQVTVEELGKAVMEVFDATEEYYKENKF